MPARGLAAARLVPRLQSQPHQNHRLHPPAPVLALCLLYALHAVQCLACAVCTMPCARSLLFDQQQDSHANELAPALLYISTCFFFVCFFISFFFFAYGLDAGLILLR